MEMSIHVFQAEGSSSWVTEAKSQSNSNSKSKQTNKKIIHRPFLREQSKSKTNMNT